MDGTFKSAPEMFTQLYTIHATYRDHVIPAIYTLLTDKTQTTYHRVIDIIRQKMADSNLVFNPQTIISDFESALIPTIRQQFPNTLHHGCYFHHTHALWRQIQRLGLQPDYEEDQEVRRSQRSLMAIAFLPTHKIQETFQTLQQQPAVDGNNQLQRFFSYYEDTWLNGTFPLEMWNVHQATVRTNNMVEGWHSKLNRYVRRVHPNLHQLLNELKKEQAMTEVSLQRARLGGRPAPRRQKYVRIDEQVETLTADFAAERTNSMQYLAGLRRIIHHY